MSILILAMIFMALSFVGLLGALLDMTEFLNNHESIDSYETLSEFKKMVRRQMYISVGQIVVLWGAGLTIFYGTLVGELSGTSVLILMMVAFVLFAIGRSARQVREQTRTLLTADKGLEGLYAAVTLVWSHKSLPDF